MPLRTLSGPARDLSLTAGLDPAVRLIGALLFVFLLINLAATLTLWRSVRRLRKQVEPASSGASTLPDVRAVSEAEARDGDAAQREREAFYRRASQASSDAIWEWRVGSGGILWGDAIGDRFGYPDARSGTTVEWCLDRIHPDDRDRAIGGVRHALEAGDEAWSAEFRFRRADGSYAHVLTRARLFRNEAGAPAWVVGAMIDISERKQTEDALRWTATHDPLTGLPNRGCFERELEAALAADATSVGLVLLGLDSFNDIKDAWGPAAGDALLRSFADQLIEIAPPGASVARLGADEFAVMMVDSVPAEARLDTVAAIAAAIAPSFAFGGAAIDGTASLGAAFAPDDGRDRAALMRSAGLALYDAKAAGRGSVRLFKEEMRTLIEERAAMILIARDAIADDRIVPFYQAKVDLKTCQIVGFEALLRWHHHRRGLQPPKAIDAAFADMELAARLTDRMIDRVIHDARGWLDKGIEFRRIAINGSAPDFVRGDFAERLLERLHRAGISPTRFELEVTESVFIGQIADNVERILNTLSSAGTTIALDDFGTGYASLSHIKQFPVDTLKIDQSFISARAADDPDDLAIVRAVIGLGQSLGISTVAEGVESLAQVNLLRREGCDVGQGYLFGRAVAAVHVPRVIAELPTLWHVGAHGDIEARRGAQAAPGEVSIADL